MTAGHVDCDVAVVGAGLSGLSAARLVARAGLRVLVVEARDRVGGRTWTQRSPSGALVDRGGQWVGPTQDHVLGLVGELGVETIETFGEGRTVEWRDGAPHLYTGLVPTSDPAAAAEGVEALLDLDLLATEVSPVEPWQAVGAVDLDARTLGSWLDEHVGSTTARGVLDVAVQAVFGVEPADLSLLFVLGYLAGGGGLANLARTRGGAQERHLVGGAQQLAVGLAAELSERVLLQHPVTHVRHGDGEVTVSGPGAESGSGDWSVTARQVIVAVPPPLTAHWQFSPELPAGRRALAESMTMGRVTKVHAVYDRPFWRGDGLNGQLVAPGSVVGSTFDDSPSDGSPADGSPADGPMADGPGVLVGFVAGDVCDQFDGDPARLAPAVTHELERAFGPAAAAPVELLFQHWPGERFTGGGPVAVCPPGALADNGRWLRDPIGALHWAGTETATAWSGYMDGAISAGCRAAEEVLVALGSGVASGHC